MVFFVVVFVVSTFGVVALSTTGFTLDSALAGVLEAFVTFGVSALGFTVGLLVLKLPELTLLLLELGLLVDVLDFVVLFDVLLLIELDFEVLVFGFETLELELLTLLLPALLLTLELLLLTELLEIEELLLTELLLDTLALLDIFASTGGAINVKHNPTTNALLKNFFTFK